MCAGLVLGTGEIDPNDSISPKQAKRGHIFGGHIDPTLRRSGAYEEHVLLLNELAMPVLDAFVVVLWHASDLQPTGSPSKHVY
jgi:hypothetical protein